MADIDMIPRSYREAQRVARTMRRFGAALAALLLVGGAAAGLLRWRVAHTEPQLAQRRSAATQATSDAARLALLQARQASLTQSVAALEALRATGTVGRLAGALDTALRADMWLTSLRYARSEQLIPATAGLAAQPGDLVLQPAPVAGAAAGAPETWRVTRRVDLSGAAFSYPALTEFLRAFSTQPGVAEVRLVDSSTPEGEAAVIGFNMTALVGPSGGVRP